MGACCGGGHLPPETKPNTEQTTPLDPELQKLMQQNIIAEDEHVPQPSSEHYTDKKPITTVDSRAKSNTITPKPCTHQKVVSQSIDSTIITEIQNGVTESIASNNVYSVIEPMISPNPIQEIQETQETQETQQIQETKTTLAQSIHQHIQQWSQNISKQLEDNTLTHSVQACAHTMDHCECMERLVFVMKLYNECIKDNKETDISAGRILQYLTPHQDYHCLNDYFHFIDHHSIPTQTQYSQIKAYFTNKCGTCNGYECVALKRNHRNRSKHTEGTQYDGDASDYHLIAIQQILDSIHCAVFHSILYKNDTKRRVDVLKQRHSALYTNDTVIDVKTDQNESNQLQLTQILQQQCVRASVDPLKSKQTSKLLSPTIPRPPHNSVIEAQHDAEPREQLYQHRFELALPTYTDLKKEIIRNTKAPLSEYEWNIEDAKAQIFQKTYKIKSDMALEQLVAILIYCNYNALRKGLLSSFAQKKQHKEYFHWAQLLFSVIKQFGTTDEKMISFPETYCALNVPYTFYSFNHFNFNGLFSTTNDISIVQCSNTYIDGIVLKLHSSPFGVAPFIDLSLFSDFKDESHRLYGFTNGCVLQMDEIWTMNDTVSYRHRNKQYIAALQLFEQIVIDTHCITDEEQYKWLKNTLGKADEKECDTDAYTVIYILEHILRKCLWLDMEHDMEIPTFIENQLRFFRHCLRDTAFCSLCFDVKKMELLPTPIQKHFMMDNTICYGNWRRLFPNEKVIFIKNIAQSQYESFVNLFATFVGEIEPIGVNGLECIHLDTNNEQYDADINDMIQKKNDTEFKYGQWILCYECIKPQIGNKTRETYCISIKRKAKEMQVTDKDEIEVKTDTKQDGDIKTPEAEAVDMDGNIVNTTDNIDVANVADIVTNEETNNAMDNDDDFMEGVVMDAMASIERICFDKTEETKEEKDDEYNNIMHYAMDTAVKSLSSIKSASSLDMDQVNELLINVLTAVDEHKQTKESTPLSIRSIDTDGTGTASPPFANRWGFDSGSNTDRTDPDVENTPFEI